MFPRLRPMPLSRRGWIATLVGTIGGVLYLASVCLMGTTPANLASMSQIFLYGLMFAIPIGAFVGALTWCLVTALLPEADTDRVQRIAQLLLAGTVGIGLPVAACWPIMSAAGPLPLGITVAVATLLGSALVAIEAQQVRSAT